MYQVWSKKTNTSEPPFKCRNYFKRYQNRRVYVAPGVVGRKPVYRPDGIRHRGGVSLFRAFMLNSGNLLWQCLRERHKQLPCEADSIEVPYRGGQVRSSVEAAVMAVERRDLATQFKNNGQLYIRRNHW